MHLALLLALITFLGWGTGDLFTIVAVRKIGANLTTFWVFLFSFLLSLIVLPFAPHSFDAITFPLLLLNIFLGILYIVANVLITEAFRISSAPLIGVIVPSYPALILFFSALFFHDHITFIQLLFIVIIFLGVGLCSVDVKELKREKKIFDNGIVLSLISVLFLSLFFTFSRTLIAKYDWFLPTFIGTACFPIILLFLRKTKEKFVFPKSTKVIFATFMVGLLISSGSFALNYGLSIPNASSLVAPIAGASPILFVISSYLIFKDKVTRQQWVGIVITLIGIVLLTAFGQ